MAHHPKLRIINTDCDSLVSLLRGVLLDQTGDGKRANDCSWTKHLRGGRGGGCEHARNLTFSQDAKERNVSFFS